MPAPHSGFDLVGPAMAVVAIWGVNEQTLVSPSFPPSVWNTVFQIHMNSLS